MSTKYDNTNWFRLSRTGGATIATLDAVTGRGYGNGGVSLPCKGCFVQPRYGEGAYIVTEDVLGVGPFLAGAAVGQQPTYIPISDVAQLYFQGDTEDIIDIVYLIG